MAMECLKGFPSTSQQVPVSSVETETGVAEF